MGDTLTEAQSGDVYPPLLSCFREHLDSEIIGHQKMISTHLFLQRLKYFQVQIPCELLVDEQQRIVGVSEANQSPLRYPLFKYI